MVVSPGPYTSAGRRTAVRKPGALRASLQLALDLYRNPKQWRAMQRAGMKKDFSWDASAAEYVKVYERARNARALA